MAPSQRPGPGRLKTRSVCRVNRSTGALEDLAVSLDFDE